MKIETWKAPKKYLDNRLQIRDIITKSVSFAIDFRIDGLKLEVGRVVTAFPHKHINEWLQDYTNSGNIYFGAIVMDTR
jgi:hypothetical protein